MHGQQSSSHPPLSLNAEVLAWRSARVDFRSPALTFSVPPFHLPNLHTFQWQGPRAGLGRRSGGAQAWLKCASLVPMAGWFAGSLRVSSESPKWGPLSLTHSSRSARDWLMTSHDQPIRCDSAHPLGGYTGGPASLIGSAAPIPPGICDFWSWVTLAAAGASLPTATLAGWLGW